ncbi:MAG TPA: nicotinate-nucleotide--dimethylbenzimidazole phosphoribosyltransferase [Kofleriaceae bacterium]|jgi:nicotinate-nucleotide--dimethylbenzimidazole phosphoribosyltransferase|nr:nicotinate-nucleotide--dimethylbenzimidazole phosphoribosyltransferase [Kofleriaceae bacterium]
MSGSVLQHVIDSITPASVVQADAARRQVASAGVPILERLAGALGAAQHSARLRVAARKLVIVAGDHGAGDPGISLGMAHPTVAHARAIADGTAAVAHVARTGRAPIVLVDAGVREPAHMPDVAIALGGAPSRNLLVESASTTAMAAQGVEAGIALAISLVDTGLDVLAVGALGIGADVAAAALLAAMTPSTFADPGVVAIGVDPTIASVVDPAIDRARALGHAAAGAGALDLLARFGGPDTAVLAGMFLAAASMNVPIIVDSYATGAAALVAAEFAPAVTGYMIAAHVGSLGHLLIVRHLGLEPIFDVGLGHGDGTGAAMIIPLLDQVLGLTSGG